MAQIQVKTVQKRKSKQAIASTKLTQELDIKQEQQQSFEIVHTILHSSLAHLVYLRHLFPEDCFTDRSFDEVRNEAQEKYRNHVDDASRRKKRMRETKRESPAASPKDLKALREDSAPEVNVFLGWLARFERMDGILEGVSKGNITAAQFSICPDPTDRAKVIESYTFRFHYGERKNQSDQAVAAVSVSGIARVATSINGVRASLMDLMKLIATYTDCMPDLPETRFLTCHIFHLPDSTSDLQPFGFEIADDKAMTLPFNADWRPKTVEAGSVNAGHHRVSLNITHMQLVGDEGFHPEDLYGIPNGMLHNRTVSRVTNTPQSAGVQRLGSPISDANLTDDLDKIHDRSLEDLTHISDSMIATQKLPSQSQPDRPAKKMRLSRSWVKWFSAAFAIPISMYDVTDTFLKTFPKHTPAIIASSSLTMING
ncbi:MAG: hypothetical protein LQ350_006836 [Teloschistes chrysophthalmus]|nr:MAG: hypothetical protein LQ350_006836 [Niorma chrysophthalma]